MSSPISGTQYHTTIHMMRCFSRFILYTIVFHNGVGRRFSRLATEGVYVGERLPSWKATECRVIAKPSTLTREAHQAR